jgi:hypothetical protein
MTFPIPQQRPCQQILVILFFACIFMPPGDSLRIITIPTIMRSIKPSPVLLRAKAMYSFADARRIARNYQFTTKEEFLEYSCPGAYQLPKNPDQVWADEWKGWDDWLGVTLDFEHGRQVARSLGLKSKEEYAELFQSKRIHDSEEASRLPFLPDKVYKDQWQSWDDFLGLV